MTLCPSRSRRTCVRTSSAEPSRNRRANTWDGFSSAGTRTPLRVHDRLCRFAGAQGQRSEARFGSDPFRDQLVERDGVAEGGTAGMRGRRQKGRLRRMAAVHQRMRQAGEDRDLVAKIARALSDKA